ncbi:hypothetical protein FJ953_10510 [Mesorhizobium sp. B2-3-6]|nr:hypothetical protein FJ953_10510 [Mesorhizobium sp. B2-3-6]
MTGSENRRETGATKYPARSDGDPADSFSQDAAGNKPPASGQGLTRPSGEVNEKTHQSEGQNPSRRAPPDQTPRKGAGSATSEHSKDGQVPPGGREPGAFDKE